MTLKENPFTVFQNFFLNKESLNPLLNEGIVLKAEKFLKNNQIFEIKCDNNHKIC